MAASPVISLDTESNSRHYYPEQLCLVQAATNSRIFIIDTIAIRDLSPIGRILADPSIRKVIHSADYDIRCLDRHSGMRINKMADPSIAARFIGITQFGLAALTRDLLGVSIDKDKQIQKSDWGKRPLPDRAIEYAADDVRYLALLQEKLDEKLRTLGRQEWVAEEYTRIEKVRYNEPDAETAYLYAKGSKDLNGRELAIFRELFLFREEEARQEHRPLFFVLPDTTLTFLAQNPNTELTKVPGIGQTGLKRFGDRLRKALRDGQNASPIQRPPRPRSRHATEDEMQNLKQLKEWRIALGTSLELDPSLIWPMSSLQRLAMAPASLDTESQHEDIRRWQREVIAPALQECLKALTAR